MAAVKGIIRVGMLRTVYEMFPPRARARIKSLIGAEGHKSSWIDTLKARDHALGKKRLDVIAEAMAAKFHLAGISSLRSKRCLEFGAGNMPSEVLIFDLLGAEQIVATDYNAIARLDMLGDAARAADRPRILAALAPFADGVDLEARLDAVIKRSRSEVTGNVRYIAPYDMSRAPLEGKFDFINSTSVLEHLPPGNAGDIMANVAASLEKGGEMLHEVDLRDHLDFAAPLAFLCQQDDYDRARDFDARGNRLRRCDWLTLFAEIRDTSTRLAFERTFDGNEIPPDLSPPWSGLATDELRVSWIGLHTLAVG